MNYNFSLLSEKSASNEILKICSIFREKIINQNISFSIINKKYVVLVDVAEEKLACMAKR